ncbi:MAG: reverse transcriptase domain-containing protein [Ruminococcus sp.]|nr:reverse transcriptase domain-containing protein [Ruminococcus sp.]
MSQNVKYEDLVDIDKIREMYRIIRTNTQNKGKLHKFELFYASNIISILTVLKRKSYHHSHYNVFLVHEPKYRIIMSEIMSDKIINHLISKYVLTPGIYPHLIPQNVATREKKGTKEGIRYVKMYINKLKLNYDKVYVLKCDIKKYFYSIDHELILEKTRRFINDPEIYRIMEDIIKSTDEEYVNQNIKKVINKEINRVSNLNILDKELKIAELNRIPLYPKGKGLPIGNMTSQLLAIYFLNDLDHYIKEQLHCKYYIRYMDDFVIFDHDKEHLKKLKAIIEEKIKDYKLELNKKTNIFDLNHGFGFLGYYFFLKGKKLIIKINPQTKRRIKKKMRKLKAINAPNYNQVKASYMGYLKVAHTKNLLKKLDL